MNLDKKEEIDIRGKKTTVDSIIIDSKTIFMLENLLKIAIIKFAKHINHASEIFKENINGYRLSFTVFKEAPFFNYNRNSIEQSQIIKRSPFMDNELVALVYKAPYEAVTNDQISLQLVKDKHCINSRTDSQAFN